MSLFLFLILELVWGITLWLLGTNPIAFTFAGIELLLLVGSLALPVVAAGRLLIAAYPICQPILRILLVLLQLANPIFVGVTLWLGLNPWRTAIRIIRPILPHPKRIGFYQQPVICSDGWGGTKTRKRRLSDAITESGFYLICTVWALLMALGAMYFLEARWGIPILDLIPSLEGP